MTEIELIELVEHVIGRPMTFDERRLFDEKIEVFNDPRYGYDVIDNPDAVLLKLSGGDFVLRSFVGGVGFSLKHSGGLYGFIDDALLKKMIDERLITSSGQILPNGFVKFGTFLLGETKD